jgi:hypothetical protein
MRSPAIQITDVNSPVYLEQFAFSPSLIYNELEPSSNAPTQN